MIVIIPHGKTQQEAIVILDSAVENLFLMGVGEQVRIVEPKKEWADSIMSFSLTGKMGFIAVPFSGTIAVDETHVTADCAVPPMVTNFFGEEKVMAGIQSKLREILGG